MFNSILWPVDGTPLSLAPLQLVIKLAKMSSASVVVLSIAEARLFRADNADARATGHEVEAANLAAARREARKASAAVQQAGLACYGIAALSPLPSSQIVDTVRQRGCDLIVMATRGKTGIIDSLLDPSCTQQVIASSPVPVLVVP